MKRINFHEAALVIAAMVFSYLFGAFKEASLLEKAERLNAARVFFSLFLGLIIVTIIGAVFARAISKGRFIGPEEKEWLTVRGLTKTQMKTESEFSDPEIEAMWNRSHFFLSQGKETPKGLISEKED